MLTTLVKDDGKTTVIGKDSSKVELFLSSAYIHPLACPKLTTYTIDNITQGSKSYFRPLIANRQFDLTCESCKL